MFHFTPKHGSWLNQVELWFSVLARRFLKRGDFRSAQDLKPVWLTISRATTRIWLIHIVGRIRVNPWYGPHRSVKRAVSNDRVGPGLAHGPNHLNGHFIRPGRTSRSRCLTGNELMKWTSSHRSCALALACTVLGSRAYLVPAIANGIFEAFPGARMPCPQSRCASASSALQSRPR